MGEPALDQYFSTCAIPEDHLVQILNLVKRWVVHSGKEWTVKHLKAYQAWMLQRTLDPEFTPKYIRYRVTEKGSIPRGPMRYLWSYDPETAFRVVRCYSVFTVQKATETQINKFMGGLNHTFTVDPEDLEEIGTVDLPELKGQAYKGIQNWEKVFTSCISSQSRRAPILTTNGVKTKVESETLAGEHLEWIPYWMISRPTLGIQLMSTVPPGSCVSGLPKFGPGVVGKIGFIQEPGCKLRAVANPARVLQAALKPLGDTLLRVLTTIPEDYTHNQLDGLEKVRRWSEEGLAVSCFDLSDATSTFPLSVTMKMLRHNLGDSWKNQLDLFETVSQSPWELPSGEIATWKTGQPLGLYPSFAAFALSHHLIVRLAKDLAHFTWSERWLDENQKRDLVNQALRFKGSREKTLALTREALKIKDQAKAYATSMMEGTDYAIIGDDIVINDGTLAQCYSQWMTQLGVSFSKDKTLLDSKKFSEFAGQVIMEGRILHLPKWSKPTAHNFFDHVRNFGPRSIRYLPNMYWRKLAYTFSCLPEPIGFGWNPTGLPLADRMSGFEELYWTNPSMNLPDDSKGSSLSRLERDSFHQYACILGDSERDRDDQSLPPNLDLLREVARVGLPINGNLNYLSFASPEIFGSRVVSAGPVYYHRQYWGHQVTYSGGAQNDRNHQFLLSRRSVGTLRSRPTTQVRTLTKWLREATRQKN